MTNPYRYDEVDVTGGGDHLGDARELVDPYPLTRAAQSRALSVERGDTITDPDEAATAVALYAGGQTRHGVTVRPVVAPEWVANTFTLTDGVNAFQITDDDPYRTYFRFWNHCDDYVYLANSPVQNVGPGVLMVPPRDADGRVHDVVIRTTAPVWLWTASTFALTTRTEVAWLIERCPVAP